jgi:hypothetical protein
MSPIERNRATAGIRTFRGILAETGFVFAIFGFSYLVCLALAGM